MVQTIDPQEYFNFKQQARKEVDELEKDYNNDVKRYNELKKKDIEDRAEFDEMKKIERGLDDKKEFLETKRKQYEKNVVKKGFDVLESSKGLYEQAQKDIEPLTKKMKELKAEMEATNEQIRQRFSDYLMEHGEQYGDMFNEVRSVSGFWKDVNIIPKDKEWVTHLNRAFHEDRHRFYQPEPYKPKLGRTEY